MSLQVFAPSDLAPGQIGLSTVHVGGRIVSLAGAQARLADAFASLSVEFAEPPRLREGDVALLRSRVRCGVALELYQATVIESWPGRCLASQGGEFRRLGIAGGGRLLQARARALSLVRAHFHERGFLEVDTPVRARTPGSDPYVTALSAHDGWLITSPEHHMKRLLAGGVPRLFQVVHASRAEELGPWHEPEFLMLEWYRAFCGQAEIMADTEGIVRAVVAALNGGLSLKVGSRTVDLSKPRFDRLSVREAFRIYAGVQDAVTLAARDEDTFFQTLVDQVEPGIAERERPTFLCDFPISLAALARPCPGDPELAERFELYVGGVELCNGYGELTDAAQFVARLRQERRANRKRSGPSYPIDWRLVAALREGLPPCGGNALGLDRLIALSTGQPGIANVMPFPAARL